MRRRGAGAVAVIALIVVIVASLVWIVYYSMGSSTPKPPESTGPGAELDQVEVGCINCGHRGRVPKDTLGAMGPAEGKAKGAGQMCQCPQCNKYCLGRDVETDPDKGGERVRAGDKWFHIPAKN